MRIVVATIAVAALLVSTGNPLPANVAGPSPNW